VAQPAESQADRIGRVSRLTRRFYRRDPVAVARAMLGQTLVRIIAGDRLAGRIVEVEAYLGVEDRAAHTFGGRRTERNATMWADAGHLYVYFTYGMHHCANVVADRQGVPTAVLLRALEPTEGLGIMRANRAGKIAIDRLKDTDLCSGPAKLCQAMAIDRSRDGIDLTTADDLYIERGLRVPPNRTIASPRIGVAYAGQWAGKPLRFHIDANPHVSR